MCIYLFIYFVKCYLFDKCYYYFRMFIVKIIRYFEVFFFYFVKEFIFNNSLIVFEKKYMYLYI